MYVLLYLETIKFYLIKLATDSYWQPSYLLVERASLLAIMLFFHSIKVAKHIWDQCSQPVAEKANILFLFKLF
jgi:hypothetical protein